MKFPQIFFVSAVLSSVAPAANILWISDQLVVGTGASDNSNASAGVFGAGAGPYPDQGIISLLTNAGHTVSRFNPADGTPLSPTELATLNTFDLLIIGRSIGSGAFDTAPETLPWNTQITKPLMVTNTYIDRNIRLGWYTGTAANQPDSVINMLTFPNPANPVSAFIIGNVSLSGSTTTNSVSEAVTIPDGSVERGISLVTDPIVPGGTQIATAAGGTATYIASWPAGTLCAGSISAGQVLSGFRMQFLVGNRESGTAPGNVVGDAGFENLTPDGEAMFLRSVTVALNNGAVPEPSSVSLLGVAALGLLQRRRRSPAR